MGLLKGLCYSNMVCPAPADSLDHCVCQKQGSPFNVLLLLHSLGILPGSMEAMTSVSWDFEPRAPDQAAPRFHAQITRITL